MNRQQVNQLLFSVGIVFLMSTILAGCLDYFYKFKFWPVFIICTLVQIVFFYALSVSLEQYSTTKAAKDIAKFQAQSIETALKNQSLSIECAYCNTVNIVPIIVSQENIFKCYNCNQDNTIKMQFFAARITNPVALKSEILLQENGPPDEYIQEKIEEIETAE